MRISDWSSDVCSSDLADLQALQILPGVDLAAEPAAGLGAARTGIEGHQAEVGIGLLPQRLPAAVGQPGRQLDRAEAEGDGREVVEGLRLADPVVDRKSTRLNSSH